jgi:hypothetical protein
MQRIHVLSTALIAIFSICAPASAYKLSGVGTAGGWDDVNKGRAVTTVLDTSDFPSGMAGGDVSAALTSAFGTWDSVESAGKLTIEIKADDGGNYDVFDGPADSAGPPWFDGYSNTLDQSADWRYTNVVIGGWLPESYFGDPNILAVTWSGKLSGGGSRKPAWHSEIFFNDAWNWTDDEVLADADFNNGLTGRLLDIETVALHEIGHALGLGHEDGVPSIMGSNYEGVQRELLADDVEGLTALYSGGGKGGGGNGGGNGGGKGRNKLTIDGIDWYLTSVTQTGDVTVVPEPTSLVMATFAMVAALILSRRRRRLA